MCVCMCVIIFALCNINMYINTTYNNHNITLYGVKRIVNLCIKVYLCIKHDTFFSLINKKTCTNY